MKAEEPKTGRNEEKSRSGESAEWSEKGAEIEREMDWLMDKTEGLIDEKEGGMCVKRGARSIIIFRFLPVLPKPEVWHSYCTLQCNRPPIISPTLPPPPPPLSNTRVIYLFIFCSLHLSRLPIVPLALPLPPSIPFFSPSLSSLLLLFLSIFHTVSKM